MNRFNITIKDLTLDVVIGVLKEERSKRQRVIVNANIEYDLEEHFLDYVQVVEAISNLLEYKLYDTLENAIDGIIKALKVDFPEITKINLQIQKPEVFNNALIGLSKEKIFL